MRRIDAIFDLERTINGADSATRLAVRREEAAPRVADLELWMRGARKRLSRHADVAQAMDYMLKRWDRFTRFLDDSRICLTNNAAERALRGVALGRKAWLFCIKAHRIYTNLGSAARKIMPDGGACEAAHSLGPAPLAREVAPVNGTIALLQYRQCLQ